MAGRIEHVDENRQGGGGGDRAERRVLPEELRCSQRTTAAATACQADRHENAEAGGDAFAAAESEPHGKHVADDGAHGGDHHPADVAVGEIRGDPDGEVAFGGVEEQREDAGDFSGVAGHVGGADIAAADIADVAAGVSLTMSRPKGIEPSRYANGG